MASLDDTKRWSRRGRWRGAALRLAGAMLLFFTWAAGSTLQQRADGHHAIGLLDFGMALVAFLSASAGSAALAMGAHLFDRVEIASRWRRRRPDPSLTPPSHRNRAVGSRRPDR